MQFFCSPIQGALSDRFGRRPVVLLSNLGLGLDYIVMALAPNVAWLSSAASFPGWRPPASAPPVPISPT